VAPGINAKMNELQAAFGLLQLKYINDYREKRKKIADLYRNKLSGIEGIRIPNDIEGVKHSYTYFPVIIDTKLFGARRDDVYKRLVKDNIFTRRYFYPLISQFPTYRGLPSAKPESLPVATNMANQVLCLPIYPNLEFEVIDMICKILKEIKHPE